MEQGEEERGSRITSGIAKDHRQEEEVHGLKMFL
jgi:hypothetical protein